MRTAIVASAVTIGTLFAFGDPDPEKLLKDAAKSMEDTAALLKTVKDKKSAEAAVPKLDEAMKGFLAAFEAIDKLKKSNNQALLEKFGKAAKNFEKEGEKLGKALEEERSRISKDPELQKILLKSKAWAKMSALHEQNSLDRAKLDVRSLDQAVTAYYLRKQFYPESLKVLTERDPVDNSPALLMGPQVLIDPWGNPYQYEPNTRNPTTDKPLIYSNGPPGSKKRIANWD